MATATRQFDFLIEYVLALLDENKLNLTDEQKKMYIPQLLAQVELRLGADLLPKLSATHKEQFAALANNQNTSPEQWKGFWHAAVPTFEEDVKTVLMKFAERVRQILIQPAV